MIWSRYNFLIETLDRFFIYNSFTNNLIELNETDYKTLLKIKSKPKILNSKRNLSVRKQLVSEYIVFTDIDDDINLLRSRFHHSRYRLNHYTITIAPTLDCNMNCIYCFEKKDHESYMSDETIDNIIKYIIDLCKNKELTLIWYGGEPLMGIKQIEKISNGLLSNDIKFNSLIITNGTLLHKINKDFLKLINCTEIQVSVDGLHETHNKRRLWLEGGDSFSQIMAGIKNILELSNSLSVKVRVNIDKKNKDEYYALCKYIFSNIKSKNISIYPGFIHTYSGFKNCEITIDNLELQRDEKVEFYKEQFIKNKNHFLYYYPSHIESCMAISQSKFLISFDGQVFKCWEDINCKDRVISNIKTSNKFDKVLLAKYSCGNDILYNPKCQQCGYLPICSGGCPVKRMRNFYYSRNEDICTIYKNNLKDFITYHILMKEEKSSNDNVLESCN